MNACRKYTLSLLAATAAAIFAVASMAQDANKPFEPYVGLPGKDVIWLPADLIMVNKMMELAKAGPGDVVVDLGSGDGRTVIGAARHGARGIGVEFNPDLVEHSRGNAEKEGVADRVNFIRQDLFEFDLNQVSVITLFLLPSINLKLRPTILNLKPGTRVIGNTFTMEDWQHDDLIRDESKPNCSFNCVAYLWVVPAKAAGTWRMPSGELKLEQKFQMLTGTLSSAGKTVQVAGRLRGEQISFTADGVEYTGRVSGVDMGGTLKASGVPNGWRAVRVGG
ncbi:MAG: methyltransferase domain-containing protein [Burkholderiales bacterium]